ncbi:hypothetical protein PRIPAC_75315 [Pristionchus pacificus]|uniref:Uncharacterized protein n=1 Tax=Pristionchus pacificus TaxID=54126 RepID=A0A2A6CEY3_PRIPA|nr:hypothetical protein PRIPAC_75315 [Pristionchus pacificus]|eukprot:PDM76660.1 hypothetical protein PRIPAC_42055 [Pristionchus pacificus]
MYQRQAILRRKATLATTLAMCLLSCEPDHKLEKKTDHEKVSDQRSFTQHNPTEHRRFIASMLLREWSSKNSSAKPDNTTGSSSN